MVINENKIRSLVLNCYNEAKVKNPSYSMRAFSKKLGVSHTTLSEILANKRRITLKTAKKLLLGIGIKEEEIDAIIQSYSYDESEFTMLDKSSISIVRDWHYFAIMSLAETKGFISKPEWIAKRLGISLGKAQMALSLLIKSGFLIKNQSGNIKAIELNYDADTADLIPALKESSKQISHLGLEVLENQPFNHKKSYTSMTLCFDPDKIDKANRLLHEFRMHFGAEMEQGIKKEVYILNMQFFPVTKLEN